MNTATALMARALACVALGSAVACAPDAPVESLELIALGTVFQISAYAPPARWQVAVEPALRARLAHWQRDRYPFNDGELAKANAAWRDGKCFDPTSELAQLVSMAQQLEQASGATFVPALADLTQLWGFHAPAAPDWAPPTDAALAAALAPPPTSLRLSVRGQSVCADGPVTLDLGGFAKGLIVEELLAILHQAGIGNAIVSAGGDLKVMGSKGGDVWQIAIHNPLTGQPLATLGAADGEAVFTSGDYQRYFEHQGARYHHILDARDGRPTQGIASVTVVGRDATRCDAAATALTVSAARALAQPDAPFTPGTLAQRLGIEAYLIVLATGEVWLNGPMAARVRWTGAIPSTKTFE